MDVEIDLTKSIDENASLYFEQAKKAKKKIEGAKLIIEETQKKLKKLLKDEPVVEVEVEKRKKHWYEKFRWFITTSGMLVVGGRDATSNEIIIKKHADKGDLVLHTDMAGSPFFVIKAEGKPIDAQTLREAADATATFSRAWKLGLQSQDVFYVKPNQVSKSAQSGESLGKGAFMIYGETKYLENKVNLCIGSYEGGVMSGPCSAIKKWCKNVIELKQGNKKASDVAKKIHKKLNVDVDLALRSLPAGEFEL